MRIVKVNLLTGRQSAEILKAANNIEDSQANDQEKPSVDIKSSSNRYIQNSEAAKGMTQKPRREERGKIKYSIDKEKDLGHLQQRRDNK